MKGLALRMNRFWETVATRGAHFGLDGEVEYMFERYAKFARGIPLRGKAVVDFGCGGGLLGVYLLKERKVARYVGYDVAQRSINRARVNLAEYAEAIKLNFLARHVWSFAEDMPDAIFCLACIMHFPTRVYLDTFLKRCDESGAKHLVLEVRYAEKTLFQEQPYSTGRSVIRACYTNSEYLVKHLPNYSLTKSDTDRTTRIYRLERKE